MTTRKQSTRSMAAARIGPEVRSLQQKKVLKFVLAQGDRGATDQEIELALQVSGNTVRPRRSELCQSGLVVDSGKRRQTKSGRLAVVWIGSIGSGQACEPPRPGGASGGNRGHRSAESGQPRTSIAAAITAGGDGRSLKIPTAGGGDVRRYFPGNDRHGELGRRARMGNRRGVDPCFWCGHLAWWRRANGPWICGCCHPPISEVGVQWLQAEADPREAVIE